MGYDLEYIQTKAVNGPRKFTEDKQEEFLRLIRAGIRPTRACQEIGIGLRTFYDALERSREFKENYRIAELTASEKVEEAMYDTALKGHVIAQQVWLYNRLPERWQDRRSVTVLANDAISAEIQALENRLRELEGSRTIDAEVVEDSQDSATSL